MATWSKQHHLYDGPPTAIATPTPAYPVGSIQNPYRSINWKDWTDYSLLPMFSYYLDPQNKIRRKMPPPPGSNIAPDSEIIPRDNSRDNPIDLSGLSQVDGEAIWRKLHGTNAWIRDAEGVVQQVP